MKFSLGVCVLVCIVNPVRGFQLYTALQKVAFTELHDEEPADVHSEYYFGKCTIKYIKQVAYDKKDYEDVRRRMIVRGWLPLELKQPPLCAYVRARSPYGDLVRYHPFKFNFCICTIIYIYRNQAIYIYYYEWYIPVEMTKGVNWEIFFYDNDVEAVGA